MGKQKEYAAVDIFKMICALLVMLIHTKPFENVFWIDAAIGMVTRFAVPFFFTVSGYFLFKKINEQPAQKWQIVGRYLLRLFRFYVIWFIIFRVVDVLLGGKLQSFQYYVKQFFFTGDGSPLWFVNALLWAVVIVSVLTSILNKRVVFAVSVVVLLIGYGMSTLLGVTQDWAIVQALKPVTDFLGIQGGLFFAFPYVAMGALLSGQELKAEHRKNALLALLFFVCLGAESLIAVMKLNAPLTFLWISALPMTWFVTRLTLTIELEPKPIYYTIRKISTLFYVLHVVIFKALQKGIAYIGLNDPMNLILTITTLLITTGLALAVLKLFRKATWLKYAM